MKKILFLLLITAASYGQTLQNPTYGNVKLKQNTTSATATKVNVQEADGTINTIPKVDFIEVIEATSATTLPVTGVIGKVYVTLDNNKIYRWTGTIYQELAVLNISGTNGVTVNGGVIGLGAITPTSISATQGIWADGNIWAGGTLFGTNISNINNTSDLNKPISTATQTALDLKVDKVTGKSLILDTEITRLAGVSNVDISGKENTVNKQNSLVVDGTGVKFPTVDAVNTGLGLKANTASPTFTGVTTVTDILINNIGANTLVGADPFKQIKSLTTVVYPNLTELSYVKGVTSPIQTQINSKQNTSEKNIANGYAGLGSDGKLISGQLPDITISDTFVTASQAAMLALTAQTGDVSVRTDLNKSFILKANDPTLLANWQELLTPTSAVTTVFGRNGAITAQIGDYTADQIMETASRVFQTPAQRTNNDATSSIQTQLNGKQASGSYEPAFTKNTAFNKNFGSTAGTVGDGAVVAANTAKVSFDATSSARLANTSGTNTGDQVLTGLNYAPTSGSANYIQNGTAQQTANLNISGGGTFGSSVTAPTFNGALSGNASTSTILKNQWINSGTTFLSNYTSLNNDETTSKFIYNTTDQPLGSLGLYSTIISKHDNGYGSMLAMNVEPNSSNLYTKMLYGGVWSNWKAILDASNVSSYALPISGGTLTGALNGTSATFSSNVTATSLKATNLAGTGTRTVVADASGNLSIGRGVLTYGGVVNQQRPLLPSEAGSLIICNGTSSNSILLNADYVIGESVEIVKDRVSGVSFVAGSGVVIKSRSSLLSVITNGMVKATYIANNVWLLSGDLQ